MSLFSNENEKHLCRIHNIGPIMYSENPARREIFVEAREAYVDNLLHEVAKADGEVLLKDVFDYPMGGLWQQNKLASRTGRLEQRELFLDFKSQNVFWRVGSHREGYDFRRDWQVNGIPCVLLKDTNGTWIGVRCIEILRSVYGAAPFISKYLFDFQGETEPSRFVNPYIYSRFDVLEDGGVLLDVLEKVRMKRHAQEIGVFLSNKSIRGELLRLSSEYYKKTGPLIWPTAYFPFQKTGQIVTVGQEYERCLIENEDKSMSYAEMYGIANIVKYQFPIFHCPYVKIRYIHAPKPYRKVNKDRLPSSQRDEVGNEQSTNRLSSRFEGVSLPTAIIEKIRHEGKRQTIEYAERSFPVEDIIDRSIETLARNYRERSEFYVSRDRFLLPHLLEGIGEAEGHEQTQEAFNLPESFYYIEAVLCSKHT